MRGGSWLTALAGGVLALAQTSNQQPQNGNSNSAQPPPPVPRVRPMIPDVSLPGDSPRSRSNTFETISGRVILSDSESPGQGVTVQRVCGSAVAGEARTDSSGRFVFSLAENRTYDSQPANSAAAALWGCELRASLSGYQPGSVALVNRRASDNSGIVIVLRRPGESLELTISATTLLAPKNARKAYTKGLDAMQHSQPDQGQKAFSEAVRIYPRFAAAWLELGKVYEQRGHMSQARIAYGKAIGADPSFLRPYERLYRMDIRESRWRDAADETSKVLRLDPYEFPSAFYFNAVANLELRNLDLAEVSARETIRLEGEDAEPRGNYVLGAILWRKGNLSGAQESLRIFLASGTGGNERANAEKILADIERQTGAKEAVRVTP